MKKLTAILLTLMLAFSLFACGAGNGSGSGSGSGMGDGGGSGDTQGGNGNGNGGTVDGGDGGGSSDGTGDGDEAGGSQAQRVEVFYAADECEDFEPENITHSDTAVAAFIEEKITFLSKVYPDGNLPDELKDVFCGISVFLEYPNEYFNEYLNPGSDSEEGSDLFLAASEYCSQIEERLITDKIITEERIVTEGLEDGYGIRLAYGSYAEFAESDLLSLAGLTENLPERITVVGVVSTAEGYKGTNMHRCESHASIFDLVPSENELQFLKAITNGKANLEFSEEGAIVSGWLGLVAEVSDLSEFNQFAEVLKCENCVQLNPTKVGLIEGTLLNSADANYSYLMVIFPNQCAGESYAGETVINGIRLSDGKLTISEDYIHDSYGEPMNTFVLLKIDNRLLGKPIEDVVLKICEIKYRTAFGLIP